MIYKYSENDQNEKLRTICREVEVEDLPKVKEIAKALREELYSTKTGIAIAANQCGFDLRVILLNVGRFKDKIMINPQIVKARGERKHKEGCLSFPDDFKVVKIRSAILNIRFKNESLVWETHKINELEAVCFQHELDHLDGKLFID